MSGQKYPAVPPGPGYLRRWDMQKIAPPGNQRDLLKRGRTIRNKAGRHACAPLVSLSLHCQSQGVFISDVVEASGLTRQTLGRLAKKKNTHRVRDLVAATAEQVTTLRRCELRQRVD